MVFDLFEVPSPFAVVLPVGDLIIVHKCRLHRCEGGRIVVGGLLEVEVGVVVTSEREAVLSIGRRFEPAIECDGCSFNFLI
jgi:hypothetical protein